MKIFDLNNKNYKFLITGGTGFIGSRLVEAIKNQCSEITILSRKNIISENKSISYVKNLDEKEFDYDVIINLSGFKIASRWSKKNKAKIIESRIGVTRKIVDKIKVANHKPTIFVSGSAIGHYGNNDQDSFIENSTIKKQNSFSQNLCFNWENEAKKSENLTKLAIIRTGIVIGKEGGFLKQMLPIFKMGLGGKIGSGNQYLSWIHINDEIGAIIHIINNELTGEFNLTSENPVTNSKFSKILAKSVKRASFIKTPAIIMKLIFGKMAEELILNGQKILPQRLLDKGYEFQFNDIEKAIEFELKK